MKLGYTEFCCTESDLQSVFPSTVAMSPQVSKVSSKMLVHRYMEMPDDF